MDISKLCIMQHVDPSFFTRFTIKMKLQKNVTMINTLNHHYQLDLGPRQRQMNFAGNKCVLFAVKIAVSNTEINGQE